jgi:hypothetical protein
LHALPEDVSQYKGDVKGARLDYEINFKRDGEYFVWVKMKGNSYGNDTIELAWKPSTDLYQSSVRYSSYGWTSEGQWEWEPEFNPSPLSDYFLVNETYTLSIWMNEDGVEIDEILITTLGDLNPSGVDPYKIQHQDLVCHNSPGLNIINSTNVASIEAEFYDDCAQGLAQSNQHRWVIQDDHEASGGQFVRSLPDNLVHMKDEIRGPSLFYEILFSETGTYYVWISTRGNSYGNDTLEYGIKLGDEYHGLVVSSFAWDSKGQWEWEPQTTQGPLVVSVEEVGLAQLILYMREDGVSVDRFLVTANEDFNPNIEVT